jgi:hypothetical protein
MLQELEIFQGVDFPLDCCLVDIILLGIDLASAFTLLTAAEEKKLSSKTSEKLQCTAIVMLRHRFSTTALYFRRRDRGGDRDLEEVMT